MLKQSSLPIEPPAPVTKTTLFFTFLSNRSGFGLTVFLPKISSIEIFSRFLENS